MFDFRDQLAAQRRKRAIRTWMMAGGAFLGIFAGGMILTNLPLPAFASSPADHPDFELCGMVRQTCVVDGDTFWLNGDKIRIADIDTPEISEPKCDSEYERGMQATYRLRDLLNEAPFELQPIPGRDQDKYGRYLRVVIRDGRSLGDQLVSEGMARTWIGRKEPWC